MKFLTKEDVFNIAPAAAATEHDGKRSERYHFFSTEKIMDVLAEEGWFPNRVISPKVRVANKNHCKHMVVFQNQDRTINFPDPRSDKERIYPECLFINSSDGFSGCKGLAGAFSMICGNGMIIMSSYLGSFDFRHDGAEEADILTFTRELVEKIPLLSSTVDTWSEIDLTPEQRFEFATEAKNLRFGDNSPVSLESILGCRREEDEGDNLWTTYNRIQENCMKGGFKVGKRISRTLTNIDRMKDVNIGLWKKAESFAA